MSEKEKCGICGHYHGSWTEFRSDSLKIILCPACLMWSADPRVETVREWLKKLKAAQDRQGVEITKGDCWK